MDESAIGSQELLRDPDLLAQADGPELLAALDALRRLRTELDGWEPVLIDAARDRGLTWAQIAPALGVASRQAAERRYLRLKPRPGSPVGNTREHRVRTARDQRAAARAVADWARDHAAGLRELAGQITALTTADTTVTVSSARATIDRLRAALGRNDVADLIRPLTEVGPHLRSTHPDLADQISALDETTGKIRDDDLTRRATAPDEPHSPDGKGSHSREQQA